MIINHNLNAMNAHRQLGVTNNNGGKSMEKLSSGLRINRAGDDAAGLSISEKMRAQIRGLNQASRNAQDGISMIQTAEGALQEIHAILQRMREITVQASNDTNNDDDRQAIAQELIDLTAEIDRISETTAFNEKKLLNGDLGGAKLDATNSDIVAGTALATEAAAAVTAIDVSGAKSNETYVFSISGTQITLTRGSDSVAQSIDLGDAYTIGPTGNLALNFSELGINLTITGDAAKTGADIKADLDSKQIVTLAGSSSAQFAIGANGDSAEKMNVAFDKFDSTTLGTSGSTLEDLITNGGGAATLIDDSTKADALTSSINDAIKQVSEQRSKLGAAQNRLEHTIKNLDNTSENLQAAESRIRDVDMAKEMMEFTKNNILQQAAQAMLAQANNAPQGVLQLLR